MSITVELVDTMGSDMAVCNAARVSFAKEAENYSNEQNRMLIAYLAREGHWSPFAHCFLSFRIKAPIFVARQLVKHQVGLSWNEESRRYIDDEPEFYEPKVWRKKPEGSIKQGSAGVVHDDLNAAACLALKDRHDEALAHYNWLLVCGVAPEMARMVLPLNTMTSWIWSGSLHAFARVCKLRLDPHAQQETSKVAKLIADYCGDLFPVSFGELMK